MMFSCRYKHGDGGKPVVNKGNNDMDEVAKSELAEMASVAEVIILKKATRSIDCSYPSPDAFAISTGIVPPTRAAYDIT